MDGGGQVARIQACTYLTDYLGQVSPDLAFYVLFGAAASLETWSIRRRCVLGRIRREVRRRRLASVSL